MITTKEYLKGSGNEAQYYSFLEQVKSKPEQSARELQAVIANSEEPRSLRVSALMFLAVHKNQFEQLGFSKFEGVLIALTESFVKEFPMEKLNEIGDSLRKNRFHPDEFVVYHYALLFAVLSPASRCSLISSIEECFRGTHFESNLAATLVAIKK